MDPSSPVPSQDEMAEIVKAARRQQTIAGLLVAAVVHAGLVVILAALVLPLVKAPPPSLIVEAAPVLSEAPPTREKTSLMTRPDLPSSPQAAAARVLSAATTAPVAVPQVQQTLDDALLGADLGEGVGFGAGLGTGGFGAGLGTAFFGNEGQGEHVAFVVDVSASMSAAQFRLMKSELTKALEGLPSRTQYQVIFFSGPVWFAEQAVDREGRNRAVVHGHRGKKLVWESEEGRADGFAFVGGDEAMPVQPWRKANPSQIRQTVRAVEAVQKSYGTSWRQPLRMALSMDPKPEVIYFMTDGAVRDAAGAVKEISRWNRRGPKKAAIFTTAMMEPRAAEQLHELARKNGGTFSKVLEDGSVVTGKDALP